MFEQGRNKMSLRAVAVIIGILVALPLGIIIFYNISSAFEPMMDDLDTRLQDEGVTTGDPCSNASGSIDSYATSFFSIAPFVCMAIVAVVVLGYIGQHQSPY